MGFLKTRSPHHGGKLQARRGSRISFFLFTPHMAHPNKLGELSRTMTGNQSCDLDFSLASPGKYNLGQSLVLPKSIDSHSRKEIKFYLWVPGWREAVIHRFAPLRQAWWLLL